MRLRISFLPSLAGLGGAAFSVIAWLSIGAPAATEPLPPLSEEERLNWTAIGLIETAAANPPVGCTGTLIAPDLVLTAAHCTGKDWAVADQPNFLAGWNNDVFLAQRQASTAAIHPLYLLTEVPERFRYDIALIRLQRQIPPERVPPLPLADGAAANPLGIVAYHNQQSGRVHGRFDCLQLGSAVDTFLRIDCEVVSGNSGAPVLVRQDNGWAVAAVVVARAEPGGQALAVAVSDWIVDKWREAMSRADTTSN
ncbi:MAG: trypsin-like peptidase domain-containing protein [Pseudomonadota bacterium]